MVIKIFIANITNSIYALYVYCLLFYYVSDIVLWGICFLYHSSEYRSCWFFGLPDKIVKAEHIVLGIPLGLFTRGLGYSNLILCIYAGVIAML
jgi:hypothetical protein